MRKKNVQPVKKKIQYIGRCKTCKHWIPPNSYEYGEVPGTGMCNKIPEYWSVSEWRKDEYGRVLKPEFAEMKAFVQDGSDYSAVLKTFHDFGCIHHESA